MRENSMKPMKFGKGKDKEGKKENKIEKGKEEPGDKKTFDSSIKNYVKNGMNGKKCKECGKNATSCSC